MLINEPQLQPKGQKIDLDAALRAQEASKAASTPRPVRPPGVLPPRKKVAADPFMKRKPPPKR